MNFDFPLILTAATLFTGVVVLIHFLCSLFKRNRLSFTDQQPSFPVIIEYSRAFFPVLLIVLLIRSFIAQPYRVPTGSLEPTIMPGDLILVTQYNYGLHLPVWNKKIMQVDEPVKGQIALFYFPVNKRITYVKRVIGTPGDTISYIDKVLYINGEKIEQKFLGYSTDIEPGNSPEKVRVYEETINGVKHKIYINTRKPAANFYNLTVPEGHYFMMGDNRDNSDDSRFWGFVPEQDFIGRAQFVFLSWDSETNDWTKKIRWNRIGDKL